jgi:hypothetical protein
MAGILICVAKELNCGGAAMLNALMAHVEVSRALM